MQRNAFPRSRATVPITRMNCRALYTGGEVPPKTAFCVSSQIYHAHAHTREVTGIEPRSSSIGVAVFGHRRYSSLCALRPPIEKWSSHLSPSRTVGHFGHGVRVCPKHETRDLRGAFFPRSHAAHTTEDSSIGAIASTIPSVAAQWQRNRVRPGCDSARGVVSHPTGGLFSSSAGHQGCLFENSFLRISAPAYIIGDG